MCLIRRNVPPSYTAEGRPGSRILPPALPVPKFPGMRRLISFAVFALVAPAPAFAAGRALDGGPVGLNNAQSWCISQREPLPNWDGPAHPDCKMVWRVLGEHGDRVLYSARYAWPSAVQSKGMPRERAEVQFGA